MSRTRNVSSACYPLGAGTYLDPLDGVSKDLSRTPSERENQMAQLPKCCAVDAISERQLDEVMCEQSYLGALGSSPKLLNKIAEDSAEKVQKICELEREIDKKSPGLARRIGIGIVNSVKEGVLSTWESFRYLRLRQSNERPPPEIEDLTRQIERQRSEIWGISDPAVRETIAALMGPSRDCNLMKTNVLNGLTRGLTPLANREGLRDQGEKSLGLQGLVQAMIKRNYRTRDELYRLRGGFKSKGQSCTADFVKTAAAQSFCRRALSKDGEKFLTDLSRSGDEMQNLQAYLFDPQIQKRLSTDESGIHGHLDAGRLNCYLAQNNYLDSKLLDAYKQITVDSLIAVGGFIGAGEALMGLRYLGSQIAKGALKSAGRGTIQAARAAASEELFLATKSTHALARMSSSLAKLDLLGSTAVSIEDIQRACTNPGVQLNAIKFNACQVRATVGDGSGMQSIPEDLRVIETGNNPSCVSSVGSALMTVGGSAVGVALSGRAVKRTEAELTHLSARKAASSGGDFSPELRRAIEKNLSGALNSGRAGTRVAKEVTEWIEKSPLLKRRPDLRSRLILGLSDPEEAERILPGLRELSRKFPGCGIPNLGLGK